MVVLTPTGNSDSKMSDIKELLESLQVATVEELTRKIRAGEASAGEFEAARKFLADNGIALDPREFGKAKEPVKLEALPFKAEERDQRVG